MEVKEYQLGNRTIKYYSIYDIRREFQKYIKDLGYSLTFEIFTSSSGRDFIKGTLTTEKVSITALIAIDECFQVKDREKISNEFVKLQTRLEKRLYMILLGLTDPDELENEEQEVKENVEKQLEENKITEPQLKVILNYVLNQRYKSTILNYIKDKYQKTDINTLTKTEAIDVIQFINELIKKA